MSRNEMTDAGQSTDEEPLQSIFDQAMKLFEKIESGNEATNSDAVQISVKSAISKFEKATNLVSMSGMFSANESMEELPTETLQYLLLPALLGTLSLKLCRQPRKDIVHIAEIYFRDFLQRCKDYGVTDVEVPQPTDGPNIERVVTEQAKISNMVHSREAKIKRYKEMKELKEKLSTLSKAMTSSADDETKREYFTTLLLNYVNQALDELSSIEQEKPLLEYMEKHRGEPKPSKAPRAPPLRPVIITRDALQKAVFGAGYPSLPAMTVEEFYDKRVRDGTFPASGTNIAHTTIQSTESEDDDAEKARKDLLEEEDDPEELARQRNMDEYKDDHRRGWGNRYNRS
ncbi:hypothetical protein MSG28_010656 [Choristoneura fumiferana]|uniref:Uncharacterized protein n=1 Tax=Choristoneura fumiferana TaxID=7141 RepID=A0ACC0KNG5_CHOFU|nr:hypothetical protein MSG28_010656 [Choristoneura fumiferana]